LCLSNFNGLE